ncbi:hypothetical protein DL95DRAFT_418513 [Leptodontidium sp. 2 PMI_412]|nr:hypothetical protein DL95DRAFT_418513 [Leptodontidium sp. 2 PMI_412]
MSSDMDTPDDVDMGTNEKAPQQSSHNPTPIVPWKSIFVRDDIGLEPASDPLSKEARDRVIEVTKNGEVVRTLIFLPNGLRLIYLDLDEGEMWPQSTVEQNPKVTFKIDSQDALDYMNSFYYGAPSTKLSRARLQDVKDKCERFLAQRPHPSVRDPLPIKLNVQQVPEYTKIVGTCDESLRVVADTIQHGRLDSFFGVCQIGFLKDWDLETDRYDLAHIAMGQLAVLKDYNDREERLEMWKNAMNSNVLGLVKKLFCAALDEEKLILGTGPASWNYYITASLARLAHGIFMYQIVGYDTLKPYHPWIVDMFPQIMNGKGVSTQLCYRKAGVEWSISLSQAVRLGWGLV